MSENESKYAYKKKSAWEQFTTQQLQQAYTFCDSYKTFIDTNRTEREAIAFISQQAKKHKKILFTNKGKEAAIVIKGKQPLSKGVRIVIAHVDSPRLDLKQVPLYEDGESHLALFETHYYGGIKKFHWLTIPLALHGIVVTKTGKTITFTLGKQPQDPVFVVADLLPHLSHDQDSKKISDAFKGEHLDVVIGSKPIKGDFKDKIKTEILNHLHKDYGITEEDFISAELEALPAYPVKDVGFDRSLIAGYGQDDRACVYAALQAVFDVNQPEYTGICLFVDKEEIGSEGNATAQVTTFLRSILKQIDPKADIDTCMLHSKVISADVNAAVTPNFTDVFELKNASSLGHGVVMSKYTGHGGKYSANDASAEYVAEIRHLLNTKKIPWQTGELGKVDNGGGGTVAKYFSRLGMEVIDLGPAVLSMHSPYEITSKVDIYATYLAYKAFLEHIK